MAILDNFEVTVLIHGSERLTPTTPPEADWATTKEYQPPGSEFHRLSYNTSRKYIGVPPVQAFVEHDQTSSDFAIDYKVKCGFTFADQGQAGVEYLVFRTYLDGRAIGSASVKRQRWERSGTYRVRKHGKRYMLEGQQGWIRQRWSFDQGLHGTIKVDVWRERLELPTVTDWGVIDLTQGEDLTLGWDELTDCAYDFNVKRPRVKKMVKLDLLPIATFEFEYRSEGTLQLLGLIEAVSEVPKPRHMVDLTFSDENNGLWQTISNNSANTLSPETMMDTPLLESNSSRSGFNSSQTSGLTDDLAHPMMEPRDAIGRSLLTGLRTPISYEEPTRDGLSSLGKVEQELDYSHRAIDADDMWWEGLDRPCVKPIQNSGRIELVDLTMMD